MTVNPLTSPVDYRNSVDAANINVRHVGEDQLRELDHHALPSDDHIAVHRRWARLAGTEELFAARDDARWLLITDLVDEEYAIDIRVQSRLNNLAVIAAVDAELAFRERYGLSRPSIDTGWDRSFLEEIKHRVRLEDEVALTVSLRKSGTALVGICPFHPDRNPSLVVWPARQHWKCYGCQASGDILSWTQASQRLTFREAVVYLAELTGMDLPRRGTAGGSDRRVTVRVG